MKKGFGSSPVVKRKILDGNIVRYVCLPGCPFTGSTLLGFLMNTHPQVVSVGAAEGPIDSVDFNTYQCSCNDLLTDCYFWNRVEKLILEQGVPFRVASTNWETRGRVSRNLFKNKLLIGSLRNDLIETMRDFIVTSLPNVRRKIQRIGEVSSIFARAVLDVSGAAVFFDTSRNLVRPKLLAQTPGIDLRVVHLIRDVRGNTASIVKNHGISDVAKASLIWKRTNIVADHYRKYLPPDCWMTLRYSDLCRDVQGSLNRLSDFIGVERSSAPQDFRDVDHHIIGNRMRLREMGQVREDTSWKQRLTESDLSTIARLAGSTNIQFGFDWPTLSRL